MSIAASPLELWFTSHPGPHTHMLGATSAMAPDYAALAPRLAGWEQTASLGYSEPTGDPALRALIAAEYGVRPAHVLLTGGAVEANWLALAALLSAGDAVVVQTPIYPQLPLVAEALGAEVRPWALPADPDVPADLDALAARVDARTRLIVLNSPHNPTGRVFTAPELARVAAIADSVGAAWLVDEVYRGVGPAPLGPSAHRLGALVTSSTSKALALPGLRVGWLVAPSEVVTAATRWREHTTLALSGLSEAFVRALWPQREALMAENQAIVARNQGIARRWLAAHGLAGRLSPASAIMMLSLDGRDDVALAEAWYARNRVLAIPGSLVGVPGTLRVGLGHREAAALEAALTYVSANLS